MSLSDVKKRLDIFSAERIRDTEEQLKKIRQHQQKRPSAANELMIQSLEYRKEKLKR